MFRATIALFVVSFLTAAAVAASDPDRVAKVTSGELKEAKASWWGFDAEDSTKPLQEAINSKVPRLIVDRQAGPWIVGPLHLQSDQEIHFEDGVEIVAKKGLFQGKTESLFSASKNKNIKLIGLGKGATLRMRKADYHGDEYSKSEWRHALAIRSCENVHVENLSLVSSGGDGIYLGVSARGVPCRNVVIRNVICDDNNRQGISVISADKLLIEDCVLKNTWGTPPAAGIDFEPNLPDEQLTDCVMRRCILENNAGDGIEFYLGNLRKSETPISVRIEDCVVKSGKRYGMAFIIRDTAEHIVKGRCEFVNCRYENCEAGGVSIDGKATDGIETVMKSTAIVNCGKDEKKSAPIRLALSEFDDFGGIDFGDVRIADSVDRLPVLLTDVASWPKRVTGNLVMEKSGATKTVRLNETWFAEHYPNRLRAIPMMTPTPENFVPIKATGDDVTLPTFWARKAGMYWIYAEQGKPIRFVLGVRKIGRSDIGRSTATLTGPNGEVKKLTIPPESAASFEYKLDASPVTGVYELKVDVGIHAVRMIRCNAPIVFPATRLGLIASTGKLYLSVPKTAKEFGIRIRGEGTESVKATVIDPTGQAVWSKDAISSAAQFDRTTEEGKIDGVWQIVLERPVGAPFEDYSITVLGVPPLLGFSPDGLWGEK